MVWLLAMLACGDVPAQSELSTHRPAAALLPDIDDLQRPFDKQLDPWFCPCTTGLESDELDVQIEGDLTARRTDLRSWHGELVVFLHAKKQHPNANEFVLYTAARAGYRALGVDYETEPVVGQLCEEEYPGDTDCPPSATLARIYGSEFDDYLFVDDEASVTGALYASLVDNHDRFPDEGWDRYFEQAPLGAIDHEAHIRWDRIVLGGYSTGATIAAMIGTRERLDGVVLVGGPNESDWLTEGETPGCAWFAIDHVEHVDQLRRTQMWTALGIPTAEALVSPLPEGVCDNDWPPYDGSHRLISDLDPIESCPVPTAIHGSLARDACMNVDAALPGDEYGLFRAYMYMFCAAGLVDADPLTRTCNAIDSPRSELVEAQ